MKLHYIAGSGQDDPKSVTVLTILLHGGALSSSMYHTLIPHLKAPSVAVDLPGHGRSLQSGPFTFSRSTELLKSLVDTLRQDDEYRGLDIVLVGQSLGGQAVLDFVCKYPTLVRGAIVSGAPIHPPDDAAGWEMPHMPTDQMWLDLMTQDIGVIGMENAQAVQQESFAFRLDSERDQTQSFPPLLVCIGEHDIAMARRDVNELVNWAKSLNGKSSGLVVEGAWHNHSIDIPERFATIINGWAAQLQTD